MGGINPWKAATLGMVIAGTTAFGTSYVVALTKMPESPKVSRHAKVKVGTFDRHQIPPAEIEQCNAYASHVNGNAGEAPRGAAVTVGGIGRGTLYGVNESKQHDERYRRVYASCMRARGYN